MECTLISIVLPKTNDLYFFFCGNNVFFMSTSPITMNFKKHEIENAFPDIAIFVNSRTEEIRVYNYDKSESRVEAAEVSEEENNLITLKLKIKTMSKTKHPNTKGEAASFAEGLRQLSEQFKQECGTTTDEYETYVKEAGVEFQETSHTYAKDMTQLANQYTLDIQSLYQDIYGEGEGEGEGGETTPPEEIVEPPQEQVPPPEGQPAKTNVPSNDPNRVMTPGTVSYTHLT